MLRALKRTVSEACFSRDLITNGTVRLTLTMTECAGAGAGGRGGRTDGRTDGAGRDGTRPGLASLLVVGGYR